jgi:hypothetical protein
MVKTFKEFMKDVNESEVPLTTVGHVGGGMVGEPPGPRKKKKKKKDIFSGVKERDNI